MYARTNNTCVFVCVYANTWDREIAHTRAGLLPSTTGRLSTDYSYRTTIRFLNIGVMAILSLLPRDLVSSDLPPVCIRKERLYCPAHSWYLISLQALGANPTTSALPVSPLGACVCVRTYRHAHLLATTLHWLLSLTCSVQEGNRTLAHSWLHSPAANISPHSFFSKNCMLHFYSNHMSTSTVGLADKDPSSQVLPLSPLSRTFSTGIWLLKHWEIAKK